MSAPTTEPPVTAPPPRGARAGRLAALVLALGAALTACTPLFLPPVPSDTLTPPPAFRLSGESRLALRSGGDGAPLLQLTLVADEVPEGGWLALQWFGPSGAERASDSLWFEPGDVGRERMWDSPPQLEVTAGEWRAVLSWRGRLVRQLRVDVP